MTATLTSELNKFCAHSKRLQQILDETKRCFDDINETGKHEGGELFSVELLQEEEAEIVATADKPPGIIVLGENAYAKTRVVHEIFGRTIFPSLDETDNNSIFRMVRFKHGNTLSISLSLPDDYDLVQNLEAYNGPWDTIPRKDLQIQDEEREDLARGSAILDVSINHPLLRQGSQLIVSPSNSGGNVEQIVKKCIENLSPIWVYAIQNEPLSAEHVQDLEDLKKVTDHQPVCFVHVPHPGQQATDLDRPDRTSSSKGSKLYKHSLSGQSSRSDSIPIPRRGYRSSTDSGLHLIANHVPSSEFNSANDLLSRNGAPSLSSNNLSPPNDADFAISNHMTVSCSVGAPSQLSKQKSKLRRTSWPPCSSSGSAVVFQQLCAIGYLSDTPGVRNLANAIKGDYFQVDSDLVENFGEFSQRFSTFAQQTMQRYLVNAATVLNNSHARCLDMFILEAFDMARDMLITPKKLEFARDKEEELYSTLLKIAVARIDEIRDLIGETEETMHDRLVEKAAEYDFIGVDFTEDGQILTPKGLKICTGQIQQLVLGGLNQAIAGKLVSSVDLLRDSYTGTLTRCLESLEKIDKDHQTATTEALKQILNAAYQVEITWQSSSSLLHVLLERMKQLVQSMPWSTPPRIDTEWKRRVAADMLANLSAVRLAKSISSQIKDRLQKSHDSFSTSLRQLEMRHTGRLDKIEEERLKLRKIHAPRVAKLALESTSMKDLIMHGTPRMSREVGRGQYGVVYSCDSWAGFSPCAIKSVVPPDDKHWNDLALEFYYTKRIPDHDRLVALRGSVIDYTYGGGSTPAVLLIMDRLQKDLYTAIKQGLEWLGRLQVAIDVVEGIRFLHSQGLVHRDVKLKNVLLDKQNRGKITDLGFCKPEAMMSGSIVGTPIHMAPELFSGRYDNSVDVYAFGILFWYVCAGSVRLPQAFEQCANKDQLWQNVKKGLRPERLGVFDDECWLLMSECWQGEPFRRPLLGEVEARLSVIHEKFKLKKPSSPKSSNDGKTVSKHISRSKPRRNSDVKATTKY